MRLRSRAIAVVGAAALAASALGATAATASVPSSAVTATSGVMTTYAVLASRGADVNVVAADLARTGATVTSVNAAIGLVGVTSSDADFLSQARAVAGVAVAGHDGVVGRAPDARPVKDPVLLEGLSSPGNSSGQSAQSTKGKKGATDPLDSHLWGMDMVKAPEAHRITTGDRRVKVGIIDTGVDGTHPDLAANFDP